MCQKYCSIHWRLQHWGAVRQLGQCVGSWAAESESSAAGWELVNAIFASCGVAPVVYSGNPVECLASDLVWLLCCVTLGIERRVRAVLMFGVARSLWDKLLLCCTQSAVLLHTELLGTCPKCHLLIQPSGYKGVGRCSVASLYSLGQIEM